VSGRIHCNFNQLRSDAYGTVSGRFSSSNPNLQNIPARDPVMGPLLRSVFIPEEDHDWGSADWSQIEYRFCVHYAHLTPGIDASVAVDMYRNDANTDFHQLAAEISGVERKKAKSVNFGVVYGMGVATMAAQLGCSFDEAEKILTTFHTEMPFLKAIYDTATRRAAQKGHITTILGRRRRFTKWEYNNKLFNCKDDALLEKLEHPSRYGVRRAQTHKALNALLQGSAADLMKQAMVEMYESGLFEVLVPHITVHDEMNVSIPRTAIGTEAFKEMQHIMETSMPLAVPVFASASTGNNWSEAK
jgi:DNA polymerase I-like protein with 3'-5' exonuclease and polymerase domains